MNRYTDRGPGSIRAASIAFWLLWFTATTAQAQQIVQPSAAQKATTSAAAVEQAQHLSSLASPLQWAGANASTKSHTIRGRARICSQC